ncbi:hypothetical protein ZIOFF_024439 [Zingiber officinale]|uniref:dUTPase-like domain-containing protein n=1 Tax=Zingiber officinale TaxID=94328 RepID=A0A8J5LD84_ZINOF|nr:hypothetical protein ZIOFF_024439 [Zingiber officinale]
MIASDDNIIGNDDNEWLLGLKGGDGSLEQVLLNIESVQSRIVTLKTQLNNVMGRDVRARSDVNLFLGDPPVSFLQNVTGGGTLSTRLPGTPPHHESECETEAVMPVSEGSSYCLLSAGDVTLDQHHKRDLCKDISMFDWLNWNWLEVIRLENEEDVLIDNQVAEEEYQNFENASHETDKLEDMEKSNSEIHSGNESTAPMVPVREASQPETNIETPSQTVLKPCYTGKRRGRKPKKKKRQARLVAALPQPKSKKLHVSSSSRSSRAHTRGPSKTEKLLASSPKLWRSKQRNLIDGRISISFSNYTATRDPPQDENEENELITVLTEKHPGIDICLGYEDNYNLITTTADKEEFPFILVHKLTNHVVMLQQKSSGAAGFDLAADRPTVIELRGRTLISTGLSLKIPWGTYGRIATRSSAAWNLGLDVGACVIDSDFRGGFGSTDDGASSSNPEPHSTMYKPNWDVLLSKEKKIISAFAEEETLIWHLQEDLGINYVGATSPGVTVLQPIDSTLETLIEEDENPT